MKIIIFTENSRAGGMDSFIKLLIQMWPDRSDDFMLICNASHPGLLQLEKSLPSNVKVFRHNIPLNWNIIDSFLPPLTPNIIKKVFRHVLRIVLAPYQFFALRRLLKNNKGDKLISVNGSYPGGETCRIVNIAWNSLGYGKSIHNIHNFAIPYKWFSSFYEYPMDYFLSKSCNSFIGVSKTCSDSLKMRSIFKNSDIKTVYNGLAPLGKSSKKSLNPENFPKIPTEEKVLLMLAGYEPRKGHEFIFKSMKEVFEFYPKIHLVICGSGSKKERSSIGDLANQIIPNQNIYLLDFIPNAGAFIDRAYILLVASQEFESFGLTAIEAMQRNTPVVSTDTGGLPEVIGENGLCGFYSPKNNPSLYAEKIIYLLENPEKAKEMGQNGSVRAKNIFVAKDMAKKYYDLLIS